MIDNKTNEIVALGRRKRATARVRLTGSGKFIVNGKEVREVHSRTRRACILATQPFEATGTTGTFDVRAICDGGGISGQAGALRLGIARALLQNDANNHGALRSAGMLTRDAAKSSARGTDNPAPASASSSPSAKPRVSPYVIYIPGNFGDFLSPDSGASIGPRIAIPEIASTRGSDMMQAGLWEQGDILTVNLPLAPEGFLQCATKGITKPRQQK